MRHRKNTVSTGRILSGLRLNKYPECITKEALQRLRRFSLWIFEVESQPKIYPFLTCFIGAFLFVSTPALSNGVGFKHYRGDNLAQPYSLDITVSKGKYTIIHVSQKRGDSVLELLEESTKSVIKSVDFPTEYPFEELMLVTQDECPEKCTLKVRAKKKIDSVLPVSIQVRSIDIYNAESPYLKALSQSGELTYNASRGSSFQSKNALTDAIERLQNSLVYTHKNFDSEYRALIHMRLAESYASLENSDYRKAHLVKLKEDLGDKRSIYWAYSNYELGAIEMNQSQEARLYESGMKLSRELGAPLAWAIGANYLSTALITEGKFRQAIDLLLKAEETFKNHGSIFWMSYPLNNLSWANYRAGRFDAALKYSAQLKLISENYDDVENEFWALYNLGYIYQQKGDLAAAQEFIEKSLDGINTLDAKFVYKSLNTLRVLSLRQKSILLKDQGAYEEALDTVKELKRVVIKQNQVKKIPDVLFMESEIYIKQGRFQIAEKILLEAIESSRGSDQKIFLSKCFRRLAEIKFESNHTEAALMHLTSAINLLATTEDHAALTRLLIYTLEGLTSAGGIQQAAELIPKVGYLVQKNGVGLDKIEYGHRKATILAKMGSVDEARKTLVDALDQVHLLLSNVKRKDLRRSYFSLQKDLYELLISITIETNSHEPEKSLLIAEQFKGLTIEEDLHRLGHDREVDEVLLKRRHYLHNKLLETSKAQFSNKDGLFLKDARLLSSELEELEAMIEWGDSKKIERSKLTQISPISKDSVMLYYFLGQEKSWCWVLDGSSIDVVDLPSERIILAQSNPVISTYSVPPAARSGSNGWQDRQALKQLSDTLLKGAVSILASRGKRPNNVIVVRDGALSNIPFAQLISPATEKYLIQNQAISYAASIESWQQLKQRAKKNVKTNKVTLVSSSMAYESGNLALSNLPNTRTEVSKIKTLYGANVRTIADGADRNRSFDQLLSESVDVLHFATHISLNTESPYLSFLLLPQNSAKERLWLSSQISSQNLPVNTVVLSGCESASGKLDAGEGMLSISRAFMEAGAINVIGSTRKIQDDSSAVLMGYMYENLKNGLPLATSLQKAQTNLLSRHPEFMDPYFWSGYQLMGAG